MTQQSESDALASVWSHAQWEETARRARYEAFEAGDDAQRGRLLTRRCRQVLRTYSTSFFIVTRFLPREKRSQVEAIYAAVRYPDEIVDTFPWTKEEQLAALDDWQSGFETALGCPNLEAMLRAGVPVFLAPFAKAVRDCGIPPAYYRSFLDAMRRDAAPEPFDTVNHLIDDYIYGSAIVVGYFLAHIYGPSSSSAWDRALHAARDLGIALQLTNFSRDVREDFRRGRLYLPLDLLRRHGITEPNPNDPAQQTAFARAVHAFARKADDYYARAEAGLDAFAPDSTVAIASCVRVYRELNRRIIANQHAIVHRESVPLHAKFRLLPPSKYWRLPLAYLTT